ncbi:MAG: glycosyltransferase family 4 protein [Pseudomonadota bacterium]
MPNTGILVVSRNFPPLTGGMERLMAHAVEALAEAHTVTVIGPTGGERHCPKGVRYLGCPPSAATFLPCALVKGLIETRRRKFNLVLGGSGVVAPVTRLVSKASGARSAVFVHGLDLVARSAVYQRLFVPSIRRHDIVIANSQNTQRLAIECGCDPARVHIVNPGCVVPDAADLPESNTFRKNRNLDDASIVLFVGRIIKRKGLIPFIRHAWPSIVADLKRARLVIVGDTPADALMRNASEAQQLDSAVASAPAGSIAFLGNVDDEVLAACYASADCLVFPLIPVEGDVEGFGMVAIEAAAQGTPTIAFDVGGIADAVSDELSGRLIAPSDYPALAAAITEACGQSGFVRENIREFASEFSWQRYGQKLRQALGLTARAGP